MRDTLLVIQIIIKNLLKSVMYGSYVINNNQLKILLKNGRTSKFFISKLNLRYKKRLNRFLSHIITQVQVPISPQRNSI